MIISFDIEEFKRYRRTIKRYKFFDDKEIPIFGLEESLQDLVEIFRGAAGSYGVEKRIILLHGPVGSSKSTICRLLKRGMERYSNTTDGIWYSYRWVDLPIEGVEGIYTHAEDPCPMNEDPIKLLPIPIRAKLLDRLNGILLEQTPENERQGLYTLKSEGELNPRCRFFMNELLKRYDGDLQKVLEKHIVVERKLYSEASRCGIATFQPKDEKNQDATELTGDLNFAKIGQFGADSDPRAFNFDGEFCVGNRGLVEFIEMLKLAKEFLYDLLGASQEHQIKPKKFPQIIIDEVIIAHSVHGDTPIPHEYNGVLDVLPIEKMADLNISKLKVFSVNLETKEVELTEIKSVFSHEFKGTWVANEQDGEIVTTTPKHSVYNEDYKTFFPAVDETSNILRVKIPNELIDGKMTTERWNNFFVDTQG
jgi:serine protein kinase